MKLKYLTLSKEEKTKLKKEFIKTEESLVYTKANKVLLVSIFGLLIAIVSIIFDIYYKNGLINYLMDGFLLIFSLIFVIVMSNIKLKEVNKYLINKKKSNKKTKK